MLCLGMLFWRLCLLKLTKEAEPPELHCRLKASNEVLHTISLMKVMKEGYGDRYGSSNNGYLTGKLNPPESKPLMVKIEPDKPLGSKIVPPDEPIPEGAIAPVDSSKLGT